MHHHPSAMEAAFQSGFASALLSIAFEGMAHIILVELKKIASADEAMIKLEATVTEAQEILSNLDASMLDIHVNTKIVLQNLVDTLARLCYKAGDLTEDLALKIMHKNIGSNKKPVLNVIRTSPTSWGKPYRFSNLQKEIDDILEQLKRLIKLLPEGRNKESNGNCSLNEVVPNLIGRECDKKEIIEELSSCSSNYKGLCIVGMDGLGKTALALTILEQTEISEQFDLIRLSMDTCGDFKFNRVVIQLENNLVAGSSHGSLLILFDNLLDVKSDDWDKFWSYITSKEIGGRQYTYIKILVTTVNAGVPEATKTKAHHLSFLSDEECKKVLIERAQFHIKPLPELEPSLIHAADGLAKQCEGLPYVARILGVKLAHCDFDELVTMINQPLWVSTVFKAEILPALRSGYLSLGPHLKQCFAYFSLFPQNYCYDVDELVQLWVAEGFIEQDRSISIALQNSNMYLNELRNKSILQITHEATDNGKPVYKLHEFNHKFAHIAASWTCQRIDEGLSTLRSLDSDTRHLSVSCDNIDSMTIWAKLKKLKHLRTFLSLRNRKLIGAIPPELFKSLTRLRVLVLSKTDIVELPDSIKKLKRLRYLDVSYTSLKKLPETLVELPTLQYLKLKDTKSLSYLPSGFHKLTNLLSLDWERRDLMRVGVPSNIGSLSALQTLPLFSVHDKEGYTVKELNNMNNLRGSICIQNLENIKDMEESKTAMLCNKSFLKSIELKWMQSRSDSAAKDVLTGLKPHDYLTELKITKYGSSKFPQWMCHSSLMVEKIHLKKCNVQVMPSFGELLNLKTLIIQDFANLKCLDYHFCGIGVGHFQSLVSLELEDLAQLQQWTRLDANDMPRLRVLKIKLCPKLEDLPSLKYLTSLTDMQIEYCPILKSLPELPDTLKSLVVIECNLLKERCQIGGSDWHKVDCIPEVEIDKEEIRTSVLPGIQLIMLTKYILELKQDNANEGNEDGMVWTLHNEFDLSIIFFGYSKRFLEVYVL
ncbi:putative disease resistance RPP13-like protein 1 isoform X1 [Chenopodium quinoa]|uniref:putative disease resistance RPP13-like protein 1 isoform X1 n=1 Tax=Chenopodium quinoa TaxID=63459 RepID=UPI000B775706|nr:putative disease resistance RPP13-like protein 1 isoform X1 [Chenopodium quinoa]